MDIKPYIRPRSRSPSPLPRSLSPLATDDLTLRVRSQNLTTRFNDMFAQDRLDAMDILRRYSDDHENNQRIIFVVMQVSCQTLFLDEEYKCDEFNIYRLG